MPWWMAEKIRTCSRRRIYRGHNVICEVALSNVTDDVALSSYGNICSNVIACDIASSNVIGNVASRSGGDVGLKYNGSSDVNTMKKNDGGPSQYHNRERRERIRR